MYLSFLRINVALESVEDTEYNFRALLMRRRQVQRGAAELYLTSYRINNAEESAVDYRVQLQRNVDEERGKYTEAKPRCTCLPPSQHCSGVGQVHHPRL